MSKKEKHQCDFLSNTILSYIFILLMILCIEITPRYDNSIHYIKEIDSNFSGKPNYFVKNIIKSKTHPDYFLGNYRLTFYCPCVSCCGKSDGITKSGTYATAGRTVASNEIPLGTKIYIKGLGDFVVEDTGGMSNEVIDVFCNNHSEALRLGTYYADVYLDH